MLVTVFGSLLSPQTLSSFLMCPVRGFVGHIHECETEAVPPVYTAVLIKTQSKDQETRLKGVQCRQNVRGAREQRSVGGGVLFSVISCH